MKQIPEFPPLTTEFVIPQTLGIHFSMAVLHINFVAKDRSETSFVLFVLKHGMED